MARPSTWFSSSRAAAELGLPRSTLHNMGRMHQLYAPALRGVPGCEVGLREVRWYHQEQLRLIRAVLLGAIDIETASLQWQVFRRRAGDAPAVKSAKKAARQAAVDLAQAG